MANLKNASMCSDISSPVASSRKSIDMSILLISRWFSMIQRYADFHKRPHCSRSEHILDIQLDIQRRGPFKDSLSQVLPLLPPFPLRGSDCWNVVAGDEVEPHRGDTVKTAVMSRAEDRTGTQGFEDRTCMRSARAGSMRRESRSETCFQGAYEGGS